MRKFNTSWYTDGLGPVLVNVRPCIPTSSYPLKSFIMWNPNALWSIHKISSTCQKSLRRSTLLSDHGNGEEGSWESADSHVQKCLQNEEGTVAFWTHPWVHVETEVSFNSGLWVLKNKHGFGSTKGPQSFARAWDYSLDTHHIFLMKTRDTQPIERDCRTTTHSVCSTLQRWQKWDGGNRSRCLCWYISSTYTSYLLMPQWEHK